jgi:hypothetical protein
MIAAAEPGAECGGPLSERKALAVGASAHRDSASDTDSEAGMKGLEDDEQREQLVLLDNTRRNAKRALEDGAGLRGGQEASAPMRTGKRQRACCPGPVRFTPHTHVRVVFTNQSMDATQRTPMEPDEGHKECAQQRDFMVTAKMVDGPPLVATVTTNLVKHVAQMSGNLDITKILHSVYTTLTQFGLTSITIGEEVDVLNSVCRKLQSLILAIQNRGSVGLLPGTMSIGTAGLYILRQLQARLQQAVFAVVAQGSMCGGALLESRKPFAERAGTGCPESVPNDASCVNSTLSLPSKVP